MTQPGGEGQGPANQGQAVTMFTQDQVNHFNAQAKREAVGGFLKDLGLDANASADTIKEALEKASKFDQQQAGQKGDVERLTGELATANEKASKVPELEAVVKRQKMAATAKLDPRMWDYLKGTTDEEITQSIKDLKEVIGATDTGDGDGDEGQQQQQGTGARPPEPNPQQGTGGGTPTGKSMKSGAEAYAAKHKKE